MAFEDPLSMMDIGGDLITLPRTSTLPNSSVYTSAPGDYVVTAASNYARRTRRTLRVDTNKITADPFIPAQNVKVSTSFYVVFDLPPAGFTNADVLTNAENFLTMITDSGNLLLTKLLGGES